MAHYQATTQKAYDTVLGMPIPTIAMIRGYCIGGGTALAVCCDIRICTENAKFGVPAAKLGLGYGMNRAKPLVDLIGPAYAKEMFFTGRQFTAQEAEKMGLVNRVVADDQLETVVGEMARTIVENAPLTVKCAKLVVGEVLKDPENRDIAATERAVEACFKARTTRKARRPSWRSASPASSAPEKGVRTLFSEKGSDSVSGIYRSRCDPHCAAAAFAPRASASGFPLNRACSVSAP